MWGIPKFPTKKREFEGTRRGNFPFIFASLRSRSAKENQRGWHTHAIVYCVSGEGGGFVVQFLFVLFCFPLFCRGRERYICGIIVFLCVLYACVVSSVGFRLFLLVIRFFLFFVACFVCFCVFLRFLIAHV